MNLNLLPTPEPSPVQVSHLPHQPHPEHGPEHPHHHEKRPRKRRRYVFSVLAVVLLAFFIDVGIGTTRLIEGGLQMREAIDNAESAMEETDFDAAKEALDLAAEGIARAQSGATLLFFVRPIPYIGDEFKAGQSLLNAAEKTVGVLQEAVGIATEISDVASGAESLLAWDDVAPDGEGFSDLPAETKVKLFRELADAHEKMLEMQAKLSLAQEDIARFHELDLSSSLDGVVAPFEEMRGDLKEGVDMLVPFAAIADEFAGLNADRQFFVMFLNDMELRPGGGFMGNFALMVNRDGDIKSMETYDSYEVDWPVYNTGYYVASPEPIKKYLEQPNWYFRDCVWSPDAPDMVKTCVQMMRQEYAWVGAPVPEIHGAIGITTKVIERLLGLVGAVTVDGYTFTQDNVSDLLEYQVEIGYVQDGISAEDRKGLVSKLTDEVMERVKSLPPSGWPDLMKMLHDSFEAKEMFFWSADESSQAAIVDANWAATLDPTVADDVLMVVDSNMAALKTDPVVDRTIDYSITPSRDGYRATVSVTYDHNGGFDWRTSRYRTWTRIFAPLGSTLVSSSGAMAQDLARDPRGLPGEVTTLEELGMTSFGAFIAIEPGKTGTLTMTYELPQNVVDAINNGTYDLMVFKQIGADDHVLNLDLDFGRDVQTAVPAESEAEWGDDRYVTQTELAKDTHFTVRLED